MQQAKKGSFMTEMQQQQAELVDDVPFSLEDQTEFPGENTGVLVTIDNESGEIEVEEDMPEDSEENRAILKRVEQSKKNISESWWQMAADLYEVQVKKLHRLAGFEKLDQYFSQVIDNTPRYGFELTSIHKYFQIDLPVMLSDKPDVYQGVIEKVKLIGVTKTKEIAKGKIKDPNALVSIIEDISRPNENGYMKTVDEVKSMIANYKHALKEEPGSVEFDEKAKKRQERMEQNKKEIFKFKIAFGQAQKVNEVLNKIIQRHNMEDSDKSRSLAFFRMCEEWSIENQASVDGTRPGLQLELKRLEEIYNTKIVAFPADAMGNLAVEAEGLTIMYGEETFSEIIAEDAEDAPESEPAAVTEPAGG